MYIKSHHIPAVPFLRGVAAIRAFVWVSAASILLLLLRGETPANYTTLE